MGVKHQINNEIFEGKAFEIFIFQYQYNLTYRKYADLVGKTPENVRKIEEIPFLPITFFKKEIIQSGKWVPQTSFISSGTTGKNSSRHVIRNLDSYLENTWKTFEGRYGDISHYHLLALLPSYLEREGSGLVAMVDFWMKKFNRLSGYFLYNYDELNKVIQEIKSRGEKIFLFGVSFALLDFAKKFQPDLNGHLVMETGGMKGRGREMVRQELHAILKKSFNITAIHSEYGMTELQSQAYSKGEGLFRTSNHMRIFLRDVNDPFLMHPPRGFGGINVIDLLNRDTCSFIQTDDLGNYKQEGIEILGRLDHSDIRGCNLLVV